MACHEEIMGIRTEEDLTEKGLRSLAGQAWEQDFQFGNLAWHPKALHNLALQMRLLHGAVGAKVFRVSGGLKVYYS